MMTEFCFSGKTIFGKMELENIMFDYLVTTIDIGLSLVATVAIFAGLGLGLTWLLERDVPCNPYGIGSCACDNNPEGN
jgi:hypothetical protein